MQHFQDFGLPTSLLHTLQHMQFNTPTPIQAQAIPHALLGKDVLGSAQTGTGKTAAFGIPLVTHLLANPKDTALVMTPTRELAAQVMNQLKCMLGKKSTVKTALLIGGEPMTRQWQQLRQRPRLVVGTPGRINDHLERGDLYLQNTKFLVLDETDRMLDMGFTIQIEQVLKFLPKTRQTMMFSATFPKNIVKISEKYLNDPVHVVVNVESSPAPAIKHDVIRVRSDEKHNRLLTELNARKGSVIVFMKTKHSADRMAEQLSKAGHSADALHGDLRQNKRDRVISNFRQQKYRILVATDVAARGLDIPHIEHVINFDLPQDATDYIHRIGRTARAGAEGEAICFVTPSDHGKWNAIQRLMDPNAVLEEAPRSERRRKPSNSSRKPKHSRSKDHRRKKVA